MSDTPANAESFNFLRWLTGAVVLMYVGTSCYAFVKTGLSWGDFSGAVGPITGLLIGYWVRGEQ